MDVRNAVVVVSRWYGGVHLGPDRFKHINNCARTLIQDTRIGLTVSWSLCVVWELEFCCDHSSCTYIGSCRPNLISFCPIGNGDETEAMFILSTAY